VRERHWINGPVIAEAAYQIAIKKQPTPRNACIFGIATGLGRIQNNTHTSSGLKAARPSKNAQNILQH